LPEGIDTTCSRETSLFRDKKEAARDYDRGQKTTAWKKTLTKQRLLDDGKERRVPAGLLEEIPEFPGCEASYAPTGGEALQPSRAMPSRSAAAPCACGSTMNYIKEGGDFPRTSWPQHPLRHSRAWDVRNPERHLHHGLFRASGLTFRLLPTIVERT
jgi:hypothetical protein